MQPKQAIAPDVTHLTQRFLNQRTETGQNSVVHNLLKTIRSAGDEQIRAAAEQTLRKYWSHDPDAQAYFEIGEKAKADERFKAKIKALKHVFKEVLKPEPPKQLTPVEQQAASRRHDSRREAIRNHLAVATGQADQVLKDRATKELAKYRGDAEVDKFFARLSARK